MTGNVDPKGKGWFRMRRIQSGDRTIKEQMIGLDPLLERCVSASVLDLGCAEGLISLRLMERGAKLVHGIEAVETRVEMARRVFMGLQAEFFAADLSTFASEPPAGLLPSYDVVLALSIAHKFAEPEAFLRAAAERCTRLMAIRLPAKVLCDYRSEYREIDVPALMACEGFAWIHDAPGPRAEWVGIFERV